MKIGILTYHRAINLGSIVQAYCVQKKLQQTFPEAIIEIIDYRPGLWDLRETTKFARKRPPFLSWQTFREIRGMRSFARALLNFSPTNLTSRNVDKARQWIESQRYDAIFVGSDTVWEYRHRSYSPPRPNVFHLPWPTSTKKIAFAASADPVPRKEGVIAEHRDELRRWISEFALILLRDEATIGFVADLGVSTAEVIKVPDPTLQIDFDEIVQSNGWKPNGEGKKLAGISLPRWLEHRIAGELTKAGFHVCTWRANHAGTANSSLPASLGPSEVLGAYSGIDAFVTDRFHGSIFAMKIGKIAPIFIEDVRKWPKPNSKGRDLYRMMGIENRILRNDDPAFEEKLVALLANNELNARTLIPNAEADRAIEKLLEN